MVTFEDVKSVLLTNSVLELEREYTSRQQINILENNLKAKEVLTCFLDELLYLPRGLDDVSKLNSLLIRRAKVEVLVASASGSREILSIKQNPDAVSDSTRDTSADLSCSDRKDRASA